MSNQDRVVTFSIKPDDINGQDDVKALRQYAKDKGVSFSYLVLDAIDKKNEELKLKQVIAIVDITK